MNGDFKGYLEYASRTTLRSILRTAVNSDRLFSLDEIVGTLATIASVGFGFLAVVW